MNGQWAGMAFSIDANNRRHPASIVFINAEPYRPVINTAYWELVVSLIPNHKTPDVIVEFSCLPTNMKIEDGHIYAELTQFNYLDRMTSSAVPLERLSPEIKAKSPIRGTFNGNLKENEEIDCSIFLELFDDSTHTDNAVLKKSQFGYNEEEVSLIDGRAIRLRGWKEFKSRHSEIEKDRFVFRGQQNVSPLRTSFHRTGHVNLHFYASKDVPDLIRAVSAELAYIFDIKSPEQHGALLNLAQHHGYPTPLLDWTESPNIAAYFAFRDAKCESEYVRVYQFDSMAWKNDMYHISNMDFSLPTITMKAFNSIFNRRAIPQQSVTMFTNVVSIVSFIRFIEVIYSKEYLKVFEMPFSERNAVLADLSQMGITAASMFPGLDGICVGLKERNYP